MKYEQLKDCFYDDDLSMELLDRKRDRLIKEKKAIDKEIEVIDEAQDVLSAHCLLEDLHLSIMDVKTKGAFDNENGGMSYRIENYDMEHIHCLVRGLREAFEEKIKELEGKA
jgi:hypothetical protein